MTAPLAPPPGAATRPAAPSAARRAAALPFQVMTSVVVLLTWAQPVLIGLFLGGDFDRLGDHSLVGTLVPAAGMALVATSVLAWRPGGWSPVVVLYGLALFLASGVQVGAGFDRNLGVHVPLGVALAAGGLALAHWAWHPGRAAADAARRAGEPRRAGADAGRAGARP